MIPAMKAADSKTSATRGKAAAGQPRRRGRPSKSEPAARGSGGLEISKQAIHQRAAEMARSEPLSEISIAALAKHFGVTTTLIHYYIGSRDALVSGIVNRYFQERVSRLRPLAGDWRADLESHARVTYECMCEHGGVLRYLMSHNRNRLFQQVQEGETDYGLVYLNRVAQIFERGGFTPAQAAMGYHLLAQYVMSAAYAAVNRQLPGQHAAFISARIEQAPANEYAGVHFFAKPFAHIDAEDAFSQGLQILLDGFKAWLDRTPAKPPGKARKVATRRSEAAS